MSVFNRKPRTRQPDQFIRLNNAHWARRFYTGGFANPRYFLPHYAQNSGALLPTAFGDGIALVSASSSSIASYNYPFTAEATEATWIFRAVRFGAQPDSGFGSALISPKTGGTMDPFDHFIKDAGERVRINTATGDESATYWETTQDWTVNRPMIGAVTWVSGAAPKIYRDGIALSLSVNTGTRTGTLKASTVTQINFATLRLNGAVFWAHGFSRAFSPQEVAQFTERPWEILEPERRIIVSGAVAAGSGNQIITVPVANIAVAGAVPVVNRTQSVTVPAANIVVAGAVPTVNRKQSVTVPAAAIVVAANAPTVTQQTNTGITVPAAAIVVAANVPTPAQTAHRTITVPLATITVGGYAPTIEQTGSSIWTNVSAASTIWTNASAASTTWTNQ